MTRSCIRHHRNGALQKLWWLVRQISPDKHMNFHDASAAFTVFHESRALSCCADLPGDSAL